MKLLLPLIAVAAIAYWYLYTVDYEEEFLDRRGVLKSASVEPIDMDTFFQKSHLVLENREGFRVLCGMLVPRTDSTQTEDRSHEGTPAPPPARHRRESYPAVIVLGGKATGKSAVNYALGVQDVIIIAPDYRYDPRDSYSVPEFLIDVPEMRHAVLDMVPSVMLIIDYLWQRRDVDTTRIVLLGYSFGAPFIPCIIALDRRPAVAAMVYGGGELTSLIRHNVTRYEGPLLGEFVGRLGGLLLRPVEPMRYIDRVSPTPLIMINGIKDEQVPRENTLLLYDAARRPKTLVWIDSQHVNQRNTALTRKIIAALRAELVRLGIMPLSA